MRSAALRFRSPASITTRQSRSGAPSKPSIAGTKLRLPARTRIARRPPNIGIVVASSTRRAGSEASVSPSSRTSANGSAGSSTEARTMASTRSLTRPASGPNTSTTARDGSGRATKASMSEDFKATIELCSPGSAERNPGRMLREGMSPAFATLTPGYGTGGSRPGDEKRRDARAHAREALLLPRIIRRDAREGAPGHDRFSGRKLGEREARVDAGNFRQHAAGGDVSDDRRAAHSHAHIEPVRRRDQPAAAIHLEIECVLQFDRDARFGRPVRRGDMVDLHLRKLRAERRPA